MSSYVEGALVKGETILHEGHLSLWGLAHLIALGLVTLPLFGLGLVFLVAAYIRYKSTELAVTTKRIIVKHGFISRQTIEINLNKAESIQVDQGVLGRLFDFGTLVISGTGTSHAPLAGIAEPMAFRKAFIEAQDSGSRREV
ncbi:PH domain-containing protein [Inhella sp.]|uniref:PH domain-containing protein n=1 Tax=Inhella sp. TaxID=1921806 RepID=UPI0035B2E057